MANGESASGTAPELTRLLAAFESLEKKLDNGMQSIRKEYREDRETTDERIAKRIKLDPVPTFKKKSHEKQSKFNSGVEDKIGSVKKALSETPPTIKKAKTLLEEGEKLLKSRQKLMKIADRSECGWATVEEYVEDELADDSDDEKRLF